MVRRLLRICLLLSVLQALSVSHLLLASQNSDGFSQIVLTFGEEKPFSFDFNKITSTLVLKFPQSSPDDLEPINQYDERLVRRVVFKSFGPQGTEVVMSLRSRDVLVDVNTYQDPFRVAIDFFQKNFVESKDAQTGLPVSSNTDGDEKSTTGWVEDGVVPTQNPGVSAAIDKKNPKRRLLQALPEAVQTPNELFDAAKKIEPGIGRAWSRFPVYVYRMQMPLSNESTRANNKGQELSDVMAEYASKQYDFGHEGRALYAYQQVLLHSPDVFEKNAVHLWKFAEVHLGQGNLTLAEGYYQTLLEKHPDHILSKFSSLRIQDVRAIRSIQEANTKKIQGFIPKIQAIATRDNSELQALIALRVLWWNHSDLDQLSRKKLPVCDEETEKKFESLSSKIDNPKTAYLIASLIAQRRTNKDTPWKNDYATWLTNYFTRYKNNQILDNQQEISDSAVERIETQFEKLFNENRYDEVVSLYENLPRDLKKITQKDQVSWQIAESNRNLSQFSTAVPFYRQAAKSSQLLLAFKANFWLASLAHKVLSDQKTNKSSDEYRSDLKKSDLAMEQIWTKLKSDEKSLLLSALSKPIQDLVASNAKNKASAKILLEQYRSALSANPPKISPQNSATSTDWQKNFSPSAASVQLLEDLSRKFAELGMPKERRQALELMKFLKPSYFKEDQEASKKWTKHLTDLAEEYRQANDFIQAGELYTMIGETTQEQERKGEAYYKGGLLLFRGGKKQDAVQALEKAKDDTNNLYYSKLASERLNQIDTK